MKRGVFRGFFKIFVFILVMMILYFAKINYGLKKQLECLDKAKSEELHQRVEEERIKIKKEFSEKHRADMISFQVLRKITESQKQEIKELKEKIKN